MYVKMRRYRLFVGAQQKISETTRKHKLNIFKFQLADAPAYLSLPYCLNVLFSNSTY